MVVGRSKLMGISGLLRGIIRTPEDRFIAFLRITSVWGVKWLDQSVQSLRIWSTVPWPHGPPPSESDLKFGSLRLCKEGSWGVQTSDQPCIPHTLLIVSPYSASQLPPHHARDKVSL